MNKHFKDKIVIVTGASSGIGLACALEFARLGAKVVLASRSVENLVKVKDTIDSIPALSLIIPADVSKEEDCKALIQKTIEHFGKIDILVNNAGISMRAIFKDIDLDVLRTLMDVNFWGTVYCTRYALPYILQSRGSIVGISSIAGFKGLPARSGYSASKFAMNGFLETLRIENLKSGLHVLIIAPGFTTSEIRKRALGADGVQQGESPRDESKMMSSHEVAQHVIKGIIKRKRNVILTWQGKLLVMLQRILPNTIDQLEYAAMKKEPNSPLE